MSMTVSVIIPSLNEEALILETLESVQRALGVLPRGHHGRESLLSTTAARITPGNWSNEPAAAFDCYIARRRVRPAQEILAQDSHEAIFWFFSTRTRQSPYARSTISLNNALDVALARESQNSVLATADFARVAGGVSGTPCDGFRCRAPRQCRHSCSARGTTFEDLGPFNEDVAIGEEWPILARLYRSRRNEFIYLRSITARTSSRRMELIPFGYTRLFLKYVWAIVALSWPSSLLRHDPTSRCCPARARSQRPGIPSHERERALMETFARLRYGFVSCLGRLLADVELNALSAIRVDRTHLLRETASSVRRSIDRCRQSLSQAPGCPRSSPVGSRVAFLGNRGLPCRPRYRAARLTSVDGS